MRSRPPVLALALILGAAYANAATIEERIEQGVDAAEGTLTVEPLATPPPDDRDVSLDPAVNPAKFRTTLEPPDIEQRIDKGLTAAGEASSIPPDYAFGAFQRGWFLTAFSLALDRAKNGDAVAQTAPRISASARTGERLLMPPRALRL